VPKQEQEESKKWIFELDADLDRRFREAIAKKSGLHRGVIKKALEDAIEDWIKKPKEGK
jgi:hypothetical protein